MEDRAKGYKMLLPPRYDLPATAGACIDLHKTGLPNSQSWTGEGAEEDMVDLGEGKTTIFISSQPSSSDSKAVVTQMALVKINGSENKRP